MVNTKFGDERSAGSVLAKARFFPNGMEPHLLVTFHLALLPAQRKINCCYAGKSCDYSWRPVMTVNQLAGLRGRHLDTEK